MATPSEEKKTPLADFIKALPLKPGIYVMKDEMGRILYVGKAKNLRNRVRSYFQKQEAMSWRTRHLVTKIQDIQIQITTSELEALLLECNLIKKHRPRYNVRLKDDKNYPYVVLNFTHPFPQFGISRKVIPSPHLKYFGPYSVGVQDIARFLLKTFQIRDCSDQKFKNRTRPCLNYEIGTCSAPCVRYVTEEAYAKQVKEAVLFLKGRKQQLLRTFKQEMQEASKKMEYEKAKTARDKIHAIEKLTQKQDAVLTTSNQRDIDVIGYFEQDGAIQWVVLFIRSGFLTGRRSIKAFLTLGTLEDELRTFIQQFYTVSLIPDEIWISQDFPDRPNVEKFLKEQAKKPIQLKVKRGEKPLRLLGMARENAKLLLLDETKAKADTPSQALQKELDLKEPPISIEGIDVSNLQGTHPTASVVHFMDEKPLKARYRLYYPKTVEGQDDFAMIHEVCLRRFGNPENPPPDLIMIDGGKGQLAAAVRALEELKLSIPICSLAKSRTESAFTRKEVEKSEERIFVPNRKNPIILKEGHPALRLLQQVRDEAHRFAIKSQRVRRKKSAFEESELTDIPGVGETWRIRLLDKFGSLGDLREASLDTLIAAGLPAPTAERVYAHFHGEE